MRAAMRGLVLVGVLVALVAVGCGDDGDDEASEPAGGIGACVDDTDQQDIQIVDCEAPEATARIIGSFVSAEYCPAGTSAIESTQYLNGQEIETGGGVACTRPLDEVTAEDEARIEEALHPTYHGIPNIGNAEEIGDSPDADTACLLYTSPSPRDS